VAPVAPILGQLQSIEFNGAQPQFAEP